MSDATPIYIDYIFESAIELADKIKAMNQDYANGRSVQTEASRVRDMARDLSNTAESIRKREWHRSREK